METALYFKMFQGDEGDDSLTHKGLEYICVSVCRYVRTPVCVYVYVRESEMALGMRPNKNETR